MPDFIVKLFMEKSIFTMGYKIPTLDKNYVDFYDKVSLMDADILLISPNILKPRGNWVEFTTSDSGCYNVAASQEYKQNILHLRKELEDFLNSGKNVFVFLTQKEDFLLSNSVSSERKGVNVFHTERFNNYSFLPINVGTLISANGKHIEFLGNITFSDYYNKFKEMMKYYLYIENTKDTQIIFTGKNREKILGAIFKVNKGNLILLPYIEYDENNFTEVRGKKQEEYWTKEAIQFGKSLIKSLVDIDKFLNANVEKTPSPDWLDIKDFQLSQELVLQKRLIKFKIKLMS